MNAKIFQIRDYQLKRAVERAHRELEKEAVKILSAVDIKNELKASHMDPRHDHLNVLMADTSPSEMIPYHRDNDPA